MPTRLCIPFHRTVGVLSSLALLVGVFAAGSVPTKAADPAPDYLASFDACPEDIIPSAGFVDVPRLDPSAADIDCITYYGVTGGTSPTTYSPGDPVTREHMALFLARLAGLVGINVPAGAGAPFEDIGHLGEESREAIGRIYRLGITVGATATTYEPARNVTRGEMALFLQRLMDLMDPAADGRIPFGFTPDDVNDNDGNFDVASPFHDLEGVAHTVHAAVTQLYELGVASGLSEHAYAPGEDMTRAVMAEFMAATLGHSNLRPKGVLVQVTPADGTDDFEIFMMVSVRDEKFAPADDVAVDWFYTDDPQGGLHSDGKCDRTKILGEGDCVWDDDEDESVDLGGNFFQDFDATPGATMSVYAWVGGRDGQRFDADTADFSVARAVSVKDADSIFVQHDVPAKAFRIAGNGALVVDLDRRSSVGFVIQLLDEDGAPLEREGVPVEVEVESRAVRVDAEDVRSGRPDPDLFSVGRDVSSDTTVLTDENGSATFDLRGPARNERLDTVTIEADCCAKQTHRVVWSDGKSALVATPPAFDHYQRREGDRIELTVQFDLVDQYGAALRGTDPRYTGRPNTDVEAILTYHLYHAPAPGADRIYTVREIPEARGTPSIKINRRGVSADIEIDIPAAFREGHDFLVRIDAQVFSDGDDDDRLDSNEVRYVDGDLVVWIVNNARDEEEFDVIRDRDFDAPPGLDLEEVELYASGRKYRTFFTLWCYEHSHMFRANGEFVDVETFEELWRKQVDGIDDLDVLIYGSGFSLTVIK